MQRLFVIKTTQRNRTHSRRPSSQVTTTTSLAPALHRGVMGDRPVLPPIKAILAVRFGANRGRGGESRHQARSGNDLGANEAIEKYAYKTMACREGAITSACYLCNTHPKTDCRNPSEAVPLLRVQKSSVIVMLRRRGASRGRPALGGSLKSLAFMRECPKARSG